MIKGLLSAMLIFSATWAQAQDKAPLYLPLDWQRVELQEKITAEIEKALTPLIGKSKFLVQVTVTLAESKSFGTKGKNEPLGLDKLGINRNSKAFKEAITLTSDSIFGQIQGVAVNLTLDTSVGDAQNAQARKYIASIVNSYASTNPRMFLNRATFVPESDIAKGNLQAAEKLSAAIKESHTQLTEAIKAMSAALRGQEYKGETTTRQLPSSWQEIVLEFKMELGILLATILILIFISGFKTIEGQKVALMAQANRQSKEASDAAIQSSAPIPAIVEPASTEQAPSSNGHGGDAGGTGVGNGFAQFNGLAQQYPQTAAYFIKLWLNMGTSEADETIAMLPKILSIDVLAPVYASLDENFKKKLKKVSNLSLSEGSGLRADSFIVRQLVNDFLVNTIELPDEVKALTASMSIKEYVSCMTGDGKLAAIFMNILEADQLGRILASVPDETVNEFFSSGLNFTTEDINYLSQNLGPKLDEMRKESNSTKVPLVEKSHDLIRLLGPAREKEVFQMLSSAGATRQLMEAAKSYFPAELILQLSPENMRRLLNLLTPAQRAELIYSRPVDERKVFFNAIGETGRLREIVDLEVNQINSDEKRKAQIERDQSKIWNNFVLSVRKTLSSNADIKSESEVLLKKWLEDQGVDISDDAMESAA